MIELCMHVLFTIILSLSISSCEKKNQIVYGDNTEVIVSTSSCTAPPAPMTKPKKCNKSPKRHKDCQ